MKNLIKKIDDCFFTTFTETIQQKVIYVWKDVSFPIRTNPNFSLVIRTSWSQCGQRTVKSEILFNDLTGGGEKVITRNECAKILKKLRSAK